jgi:hypothetical protein
MHMRHMLLLYRTDQRQAQTTTHAAMHMLQLLLLL